MRHEREGFGQLVDGDEVDAQVPLVLADVECAGDVLDGLEAAADAECGGHDEFLGSRGRGDEQFGVVLEAEEAATF